MQRALVRAGWIELHYASATNPPIIPYGPAFSCCALSTGWWRASTS